jgi:leucyl aminopeptidase
MQFRFTNQQPPATELTCYFFDGQAAWHSQAAGGPTSPGIDFPVKIMPQANGGGLALMVQLQAFKYLHPGDLARVAGAACLKHARKYGLKQLCWMLDAVDPSKFSSLVAGALLCDYEFTRYKGQPTGKPPKKADIEIAVVAGQRASLLKPALALQQKLISSVNFARDLANTPGSDLVPEALAETAAELSKEFGFNFSKLSAAQLKQQGYVGCIAVGQASEHPPVLFSLEYKPKKVKAGTKPLCFVGKGITFDTGGISIKPWDGMWDMKGDMGGAAAVLGIFKAIGQLKPDVAVTGVVAAAENMPGGRAYLPGDVLRYKNGRTVEIKSTDAEGRLVLADALIHAQRKLKQQRIVEFSTLTGACARALGPQYIGLMSNYPALAAKVKAAGEASGELTWELPLHPEYRAMINSPVSDIKNTGGALAGAQTAGWFLHEFIDEGTEYVHLDIAGPFLAEKDDKYWSQPGATGCGVRLGLELIGQH